MPPFWTACCCRGVRAPASDASDGVGEAMHCAVEVLTQEHHMHFGMWLHVRAMCMSYCHCTSVATVSIELNEARTDCVCWGRCKARAVQKTGVS